ncbi:hypothetical protein Veis_0414 [Verminephrobacter eiseniae EF01-2]|uniref:Uncharacterized protein n=1 Tax=Verminephrobacter eiseniae (strain EF01-2) TaxID=391735 RepID=A1WEZ5_VEREI|nr:hypothetical protein Veis_0414 [Verminephrobacter eiseniae EF01-2]
MCDHCASSGGIYVYSSVTARKPGNPGKKLVSILPRRPSRSTARSGDGSATLVGDSGQGGQSRGQTQVYLTPLHAKTQTIGSLIVNIRTASRHVHLESRQVVRWL